VSGGVLSDRWRTTCHVTLDHKKLVTPLNYLLKAFEELTALESMRIYQLRQQVFMLEQECLYPDIDGVDPSCSHLLGMQEEELISYLRIVPPGHHFKEPALGRIIVTPENRGGDLGPELIRTGIQLCRKIFPSKAISIEAQFPLQTYYEQFGFVALGPVYQVDNIPHIHMKLVFLDES
jgi:ElaA protein